MKYSILNNMHYIYKITFKHAKKFHLMLILNFIASLLIPILGTLIASMVVYALTRTSNVIITYTILIGSLTVLTLILEIIKIWSYQRYTWENTFMRCTNFWIKMCKQTISADYERIEPKQRQRVVSKAFEALESNWVGIEGMMKQTPIFFINIIGMTVYAIIVAIYSPWILLILVIMSIVNFYLTKKANDYLEKNLDSLNDAYYEKAYLNKDVVDSVNGKDIRIYKMEKWFTRIFISLTKKRVLIQSKIQQKNLIAGVSDTLFLFIRDGVAYFTLVIMAINNQIDVTTFTFMIGIVTGFSTWLNGFVQSFNQLRTHNVVVNNYREFLNEKDEFNHDEGIDINKLQLPLTIEFKNVCFAYPGTTKQIINNLNFSIEPGEKIAIVGNNGAGKTTLIKLLCGLYQPTQGEILINNQNIKDFNIDEYMSLLSVVFQDSIPFAFSIVENVTCQPLEEYDHERFIQAISQAGLKEKVDKLEDHELTYITQVFEEKGIRLSGGETQKLMLARALYKNAPLLILDEPTAALDPISEEKMYLTYDDLTKNNTSIFISHRLSSTKFCNRIFFLENGQIVETGTHDELINKHGKYYDIYMIQSKYYKEEGENNEA